MSFNIINLLKSSKIPQDLTLNQIIDYYDTLSADLFYEPSVTELENYIYDSQNNNSDTSSNVSWVGGSIDNDPIDSNISDPIFHGVTYFNDRFLHRGHHFCSYRNCQSYNFLCGNGYSNQYGSVKKCGYQCNYYYELPHDCKGEGYRFLDKDSHSHDGPKPNKRRRKSKSIIKISYCHSDSDCYDDGSDYDHERWYSSD